MGRGAFDCPLVAPKRLRHAALDALQTQASVDPYMGVFQK